MFAKAEVLSRYLGMLRFASRFFSTLRKFAVLMTAPMITLLSCENSDKEIADLTKRRIGVEEARGITAIYTMGGSTKAILKAPLMRRVTDTASYSEFPETIAVDFYSPQGKIESKLTANYAKYSYSETSNDKSLVFLKDSVKVISMDKGDTLYCQELYWDINRKGQEFYTDKPVRIRKKDGTALDGTGMDAPQDFKSWHIIHGHGPLVVPQSQFPK